MGTTKKTNKIIFFLVNAGIQGLLSYTVIRQDGFSGPLLLPLAVCALLDYLLTVKKSPEQAPACSHLVTHIFLDFCMLMALRARVLISMWDVSDISQVITANTSMLRSASWIILALSVLLFLISAFSQKRIQWAPLLWGVLGMGAVLVRWCYRLSWPLGFSTVGEEIALLVLLLTAFCIFAYQTVLATAPEKRNGPAVQIAILYIGFILLNQLMPDYLRYYVSPAFEEFCDFAASWKVVIPLVILACFCAAMDKGADEGHFEPDYLTLAGFFGILLELLLLFRMKHISFPVWLLILGASVSLSIWLRNGIAGKKTLRWKVNEYIWFHVAAFMLVLGAIEEELWLTLAVTLAFAFLFYVQFDRMRAKPRGNLLWLSILGFLAAEALSVRFFRGITEAHGIMLAAITLAAALCLLILNRPHPSGRVSASNGLRAAVCGGAAVLLLLVTLA